MEEDILELFGCSKIEQAFATSFKALVSPPEYTIIYEHILLDSDPGPTARSALSLGHDAYFAMVVQCFLLACVLQTVL